MLLLAISLFVQCDCDEEEIITEGIQHLPPGDYFIRGDVKDVDTNHPLSGVTITITTTDGKTKYTLTTNSQGIYSQNITEVDTDINTYIAAATKEGYFSDTGSIKIDHDTRLVFAPSFRLKSKETLPSSEITVSPGDSVVGDAQVPHNEAVGVGENGMHEIIVAPEDVEETTTITITTIPTRYLKPIVPDGFLMAGVECLPSSYTFQEPITLIFPLPFEADPGLQLPLLVFRDDLGEWEPYLDPDTGEPVFAIAIVEENGRDVSFRASASITHFTTYALEGMWGNFTTNPDGNHPTYEGNEVEEGTPVSTEYVNLGTETSEYTVSKDWIGEVTHYGTGINETWVETNIGIVYGDDVPEEGDPGYEPYMDIERATREESGDVNIDFENGNTWSMYKARPITYTPATGPINVTRVYHGITDTGPIDDNNGNRIPPPGYENEAGHWEWRLKIEEYNVYSEHAHFLGYQSRYNYADEDVDVRLKRWHVYDQWVWKVHDSGGK